MFHDQPGVIRQSAEQGTIRRDTSLQSTSRGSVNGFMPTKSLERLSGLLFDRSENADYLRDSPPWRVGVSMAATWSWGAAVAVAIAVMHTKGFIPYVAWAVSAAVAIPVFGLAYVYIPNLRRWKSLLPMLLLWGFIGFFAIVMNLSALKAALGGGVDIEAAGIMSEQAALYTTLAVGVLIAWYIHKTGLQGSVFTDIGQLTLQFLGVIGILVIGLATGARADIQMMVGDQSAWMVGAVLGLLAGTTASGMQWQRIETLHTDRDKLRAAFVGGGIYSAHQIIVTFAALVFDGSLAVSIPFLLAVLAVATSTADSGSALLQYVSQRFSLPASAGSLVTLGAVAIFPFIAQMGVTGIWTFYATTRWKVIAALLGLTLIYNFTGDVSANVAAAARRFKIVLPENVFQDQIKRPLGEATQDD